MNAPKMSHTVGLLYPDSAQLRAALGARKPGCDNCSGLNSTNRGNNATNVRPLNAMAAPGNGSKTSPTMTPTKMEKKYHACCGRPVGTGSNARMTATATGATAFHIGLGDFAVESVAAFASAPLDTSGRAVLASIAILHSP